MRLGKKRENTNKTGTEGDKGNMERCEHACIRDADRIGQTQIGVDRSRLMQKTKTDNRENSLREFKNSSLGSILVVFNMPFSQKNKMLIWFFALPIFVFHMCSSILLGERTVCC